MQGGLASTPHLAAVDDLVFDGGLVREERALLPMLSSIPLKASAFGVLSSRQDRA